MYWFQFERFIPPPPRPNPSHLCNIELYNTRVDKCKCISIIFLLLRPRLREQDVYHLVSPGPAMREIGTPIPIRESVKRGTQAGAVVSDPLLPNSASDGVTLLQVLGVSLCFPGRLANNQEKKEPNPQRHYTSQAPQTSETQRYC